MEATQNPPPEPPLLERDLGPVPETPGRDHPQPGLGVGVRVPAGEACPAIADLDPASAVAAEAGAVLPALQLGRDLTRHDVGNMMGEHAGLRQ